MSDNNYVAPSRVPSGLEARYKAYGVEPPTAEQERALADLWRKIRVTSAQLPDATKEPQSWLHELGPRLAAYMRKLGIINNGEINRIRDLVKASVESNKRIGDEDFAFDILKMQLANRQEVREFMAKTKPAPTKATDDTDAKVTILLSRLSAVEKKYHRENEDNSILRDMLCDGYPKVHDWFDLVRLPDYDVDEAERRYDNIQAARADVPVKTTLDEVDKSIEALPPTVANDLPKSDKASDWFPRCPSCNDALVDGKCTNPACPALFAKDDWAEFWISAKHLLARIDIPERGVRQWVHAFYKIDEKKDSLKNLGKTKGDILTEIRKEVDATLAQWEEDDIESHRLVTKIRNADKPAETPTVKTETHTPPSHDEPVALPVEPTPPVGVYSPEPKSTLRPVEAPPLNEGKNHHMEAPVIAYTTIIINDHRVNVTAREGATAEQVHDTVIALINGLRLIAADDTIKSYAAVIDNRDKTIRMKGEVKTAEPAPATMPATNGNGNGHATDGGTVGCAMIEVGTARKTGNPQLNFACDGMNFPIHYSLPVGDMVNLLSKVKQANGQPFTAADLTPNRKFGGAWRVVWEPSKSDPKYKNVVEVLPA